MKKNKIIIIGKKGFVAKNLFQNLAEKNLVKKFSFLSFNKLNISEIIKYDTIINCTINKKYVEKSYSEKNDLDYKIVNKIKKTKIKYIFLSTRKVYEIGENIKETSKLNPKDNYSKNKLITEKKIFKILKKRLLILRITNLIGIKNSSRKNIHTLFIDHFFNNVKKGYIFENKNIYKDFLSVYQFSNIINALIKKKSYGIFNISSGKKIYLKKIISWLNHYNSHKKKLKFLKNIDQESFYLNNSKVLRETKLKISLINLEKDCKRISKLFFKK